MQLSEMLLTRWPCGCMTRSERKRRAVEGLELLVLRSIDWDVTTIDVLMVEMFQGVGFLLGGQHSPSKLDAGNDEFWKTNAN